jgi:hypothetical protein
MNDASDNDDDGEVEIVRTTSEMDVLKNSLASSMSDSSSQTNPSFICIVRSRVVPTPQPFQRVDILLRSL